MSANLMGKMSRPQLTSNDIGSHDILLYGNYSNNKQTKQVNNNKWRGRERDRGREREKETRGGDRGRGDGEERGGERKRDTRETE